MQHTKKENKKGLKIHVVFIKTVFAIYKKEKNPTNKNRMIFINDGFSGFVSIQ